jgi:dynein heavy chain
MTYKNTASIYKGLALCGAWGCFDEFNRIDLEVLSVCAQQIACVLNAIRDKVASFQFTDGQTLSINGEVGYFITMNPGYAGRQELPENLKELFRGVAMMVPDRQIIMKVKLAAAGYQEYAPLSFKFHVLYRLCEQQLSKQAHYDFGLRNILSVLRTAGGALRKEKKQAEKGGTKMRSEYYLLCRTLRDMNMSKYVAEDVGLFLSLINDLFPGLNPEKAVFPDVEAMIKECVEADNLQMHPTWVGKIVQLYETYEVRHGIMVVGAAGCGKSKIIQTLRDALTKCRNKHTLVKLNPKGITAKQMYGFQDPVANEWTEGIFTALWKKSNDPRKKGTNQWMVMDGPVDAIWIEDLNTVLDDNRMLTCANGDRIPMLATMKAMFEPENLNNASPATVSRAGIIYVSASDLGSLPIVQSWIQTRANSTERERLTGLFDKYLQPTLTFLKESGVQPMLSVAEMNYCTTCYTLLQAMLPEITEKAACMPVEQLERVFIYCMTWSFGALLEPEDQDRFDLFMRDLAPDECPPAPAKVYDMRIDRESGNTWVDYTVPGLGVKPGEEFDFAALLVPTTDSVRTETLIDMHCKLSKPILLVGGPGTAKTSIVLQYVRTQPKEEVLFKQMNFSSATTPQIFQNIVESSVDKRSAKSFGPPANKKLICFMDDVSMPEINSWGDQPTLEIIRQLTELGYLWNLEKGKAGDPIVIEDLRYVLAMNHPGGGKNDIPQRMKRHCANINIAMPSMTSINQIFGAILKLQYNSKEFKPDVLAVSQELVGITMELYTKTKKRMLPTPAKFHYIFNLRDVSRVFQGMLTCPIDVVQNSKKIGGGGEVPEGSVNPGLESDAFVIALWKHECERVFQDKLISKEDKDWLDKCMKSIVIEKLGEALASASMEDTRYFVNFLRDAPLDPETDEPLGPRPDKYEACRDLAQLRSRSQHYMSIYDDEVKVGKLQLVLFDAALHHMARISRILMMPKGSALLVGVGGSGKQSLTKLASYIGGYEKFQIQVSKTYNQSNLMEDIKNQYLKAGFAGLQPNAKPIAFVFTDAEVKEEGFLEYINMILSTGEIPGLIAKDELEAMIGEMAPLYSKKFPDLEESRDAIIKFFFDQVRANLHIVLCFSPVGEKFRDRALKFPALFSGTTIDWFLPWPEQALQDVAASYFDEKFGVKVDSDAAKQELINHCASVHMAVTKATQDYFGKFRR